MLYTTAQCNNYSRFCVPLLSCYYYYYYDKACYFIYIRSASLIFPPSYFGSFVLRYSLYKLRSSAVQRYVDATHTLTEDAFRHRFLDKRFYPYYFLNIIHTTTKKIYWLVAARKIWTSLNHPTGVVIFFFIRFSGLRVALSPLQILRFSYLFTGCVKK